jgi:endonuclease/exonuclease/phosphatase family metal-dependent hydrolase
VLKGRPYGGCATLWRSKILNDVVRLDINSRRVVAIKCSVGGNKLVLINVYLPCDTDDTLEEFSSELPICENLINDHDDHEVIIGGDFNIDLSRVSANQRGLYNLCKEYNVICADFHSGVDIDYTFSFADSHTRILDYFVISERLFNDGVSSIKVCHEVDNLSDHEPLVIELSLKVSISEHSVNQYRNNFAWYKASREQIQNYKLRLTQLLSVVSLPVETLVCSRRDCADVSHL